MDEKIYRYRGIVLRILVDDDCRVYVECGGLSRCLFGHGGRKKFSRFQIWRIVDGKDKSRYALSEEDFFSFLTAAGSDEKIHAFFRWFVSETIPQLRRDLCNQSFQQGTVDQDYMQRKIWRLEEARQRDEQLFRATVGHLSKTAAHMRRLHRLAIEYRGILSELAHEFKGRRTVFGKLIGAVDTELAYGKEYFPELKENCK